MAARENAISTATLKDLQGLVKAITLNSKIDESRDLAHSIQEGMVSGVREQHAIPDRGVHSAPFYVLIGANMPAVLAELGFVTQSRGREAAARPRVSRAAGAQPSAGPPDLPRGAESYRDAAIDRRRPPAYSGRRAMSSGTFLALEPIVTWIKVEKPSFDLVGVVLNSFRLAGVLLLLALGLGLLFGAVAAAFAAAGRAETPDRATVSLRPRHAALTGPASEPPGRTALVTADPLILVASVTRCVMLVG